MPQKLADSELMLGALMRAGFEVTLDPQQAQVLLVNTCAFIEPAKKESIDAILEAAEVKKRGSGQAAGSRGMPLAALRRASLREQLPEVDIFVGTGNFLDLARTPAPHRSARVAADSVRRRGPSAAARPRRRESRPATSSAPT